MFRKDRPPFKEKGLVICMFIKNDVISSKLLKYDKNFNSQELMGIKVSVIAIINLCFLCSYLKMSNMYEVCHKGCRTEVTTIF